MSDTNVTIQETIVNIDIVNQDVDVQVVDTETINVDVQDSIILVDITNGAGPQGPAGPGVAIGGTPGQYLIKNSVNNYDTAWITPPFVPYSGATGDVNLGVHGIIAPLLTTVVNKTGSNLTKAAYKVLRVRKVSEGGAQGQRLAVVLAQGNGEPNSTDVLGINFEDIANNQEGEIVTDGPLININTTGSLQGETWVDGDVLFLSPTVPGGLTKVKPSAPNHLVIMAYVEYAHQNNGKLYIKVQTSYEIEELHDVAAVNASDGDVLQYVTSTGLWTKTSSINFGTW
jgi:hypothetical protein